MCGFNSATAVKPWRQAIPGLCRYCGCSFNSATAVKPWRPRLYLEKDSDEVLLQFGHGGEAVETTNHRAFRANRVRFNSATAVKPWRRKLNVVWPCC